MPYVKPGRLLGWKKAVASEMVLEDVDIQDVDKSVKKLFRTCSVCGKEDCEMTVVKVNGVYVHQEEAAEAEPEFEYIL